MYASVLAVGGYLLYQSRWRFWWRTLSTNETDNLRSDRAGLLSGQFQSLFTRITEQGNRLREQAGDRVRSIVETPAPPEGQSEEEDETARGRRASVIVRKVIPLVVLLGGAGVILYFWPAAILSAVMLALIGVAVALLGDTALVSMQPYWQKVRNDYGSLMGVYLGVGLTVVSLFLIGASDFLRYPKQAWLGGQYFPFRLLQLCLLAGIVLVIRAQGKVAFKYFTFYRATRPQGQSPRTYHVFDFTKAAAWPAYLSFDPDELTKIVVLGRRQDRHYEVLDHSTRLSLMRQPYTILNLQALQGRIGLEETAIADSGDFFQATVKYVIMPRSFEALQSSMMAKLGNIIPERPMAVFLEDLFQNDTPRVLLDRVLKQTADAYVGEHIQTARDMRESFVSALAQARERGMLTREELTPGQDITQSDPGNLSLSIVGYEQLRAIRDSLNLAIEGPSQQWRSYRVKRLQAKQTVPQMFRERLRQHFVAAIGVDGTEEETGVLDEAISCLLECSGIELEVETFDFAPGSAAECEQMVETIDKEFSEKFNAIEARLQERETKLLDFFQAQTAEVEGGKRKLIEQLIQTAPQVLPFLLQNPVGQDFVRLLTSMGESAMRDRLGRLRQMSEKDPHWEKKVIKAMESRGRTATDPKKKADSEGKPIF